MRQHAQQPDIFIVGGGPAGLAAAILASQKGFRVMVADHAQPPIDKACGEGLMPDAIAALGSLGVRFDAGEAIPFRGIRFREANARLSVEAKFPQHSGMGVRRTVLHAKLVQRAAEVGVSMQWGTRATVLGNGEVACDSHSHGRYDIRCHWIIGADGEASQVRKWVAPEPPRHEQIRFGSRRHFRMVPWTDFVEVYWARTCQIVVGPVGSEEICVAVTSRNSHTKLDDALREVPELAERLAGVPVASVVRGARCALRRLRAVHRGCFALIGDASGSVDPITGEGLGLAFQQAGALSDALRDNDLRRYQTAHDRIARVSRMMSRLMLLMDARPWFRMRVLRALAVEPYLFSRLLNTHVQALAPSDFGVGNALRLGWRVVSAPGLEA